MKRFWLVFILSGFWISGSAQVSNYLTKLNIPYYADSLSKSNKYIQSTCVLDIYYPENSKNFATVIWFHGGGLTGGEKEIPEALKKKNIAVVGVGYRLHPLVTSPKYIEDAAAAVAWVFKNIATLGGDRSLIFVSGHSAGGYLAAMVGLDETWLQRHGISANQIAGLIPLSGQMITHFTIRKERGIKDTQPVIDNLAPLFHVNKNAPPLLLITGDRNLELLGRYEENAYMWRMMKLAGHERTRILELQGYGHSMTEPAFPLLLEEVQQIMNEKKKTPNANKP